RAIPLPEEYEHEDDAEQREEGRRDQDRRVRPAWGGRGPWHSAGSRLLRYGSRHHWPPQERFLRNPEVASRGSVDEACRSMAERRGRIIQRANVDRYARYARLAACLRDEHGTRAVLGRDGRLLRMPE